MSLMSRIARLSVVSLQNCVRLVATSAPSVDKKRKSRYYKYRPKPKLQEEERLELERETAEMRMATQQLVEDPVALDQLMEEGLPQEYDVISSSWGSKIEAKREHERLRQVVKKKIIERKYYRQPPEINLLTWTAKEQIRFLNEKFPEEWTPDQLTKSFPISRNGVIKLLKANNIPKTAEQIYEHDRGVVENWKLLKEGGRTGGPLAGRKLTMIEEGNMTERLSNFGGVPSLPKKPAEEILVEPLERTKPGLFESLVSDSFPRALAKTKTGVLPDNAENRKLISEIVDELDETKRKPANRLAIISYLREQRNTHESVENRASHGEEHSERSRFGRRVPRRRGFTVSNTNLLKSRLDEMNESE